MGAGTGFERGAQSISNSVMSGIRIGLQQKRNEQLDELYNHAIGYNLEWKRGIEGLPPSYHDEEEEAARAAATRPAIPSSVPIVTPGPMGISQTRFETGKPMQPMPTLTQRPTGAMALLPSSMRLRAWGPCQGCAGVTYRIMKGYEAGSARVP